MPTTYYAITALGWGVGETLKEAYENYRSIQLRNFPHLDESDLEEAWGFIWDVPEGTTGFFHTWNEGLKWKLEDGSTEKSDPSQRVAHVGNVPEQFRLTG